MLQVFEHATYRQESACCPKCSWKGAGAALKQGEYFFMSDMVEVYCPDCTQYIGFISLDPEEDFLDKEVHGPQSTVHGGHPAATLSRESGGRSRELNAPSS